MARMSAIAADIAEGDLGHGVTPARSTIHGTFPVSDPKTGIPADSASTNATPNGSSSVGSPNTCARSRCGASAVLGTEPCTVDEVQVEARLTPHDVEGQVETRLPTSFQEGCDQLRTALALPVLAEEEESTRHFRTTISESGNSCRAAAACHRDSLDRQSDLEQRRHGRRSHYEHMGGSQEETALVLKPARRNLVRGRVDARSFGGHAVGHHDVAARRRDITRKDGLHEQERDIRKRIHLTTNRRGPLRRTSPIHTRLCRAQPSPHSPGEIPRIPCLVRHIKTVDVDATCPQFSDDRRGDAGKAPKMHDTHRATIDSAPRAYSSGHELLTNRLGSFHQGGDGVKRGTTRVCRWSFRIVAGCSNVPYLRDM